MLTVDLLGKIIENPLKVRRYSSRFTRRKLFGAQPIASFPLPLEMKVKFSEIFRSVKVQSEYPCITASNHKNIMPTNTGVWVDFFKALCDNSDPTVLARAILSAAVEFINHHSGSCYHEFVILHQLPEILKFKSSEDYHNELFSLEVAALKRVIEIQALLDDAQHSPASRTGRVHQALQLITESESVTLDARKSALLALECYHVSQASLIENKKFDALAHEKKNFRFILELALIQKLELDPYEKVMPQVLMAESKRTDERIQIITLGEIDPVTISQPRELGSHWDIFFRNLSDPENVVQHPVDIMTRILTSDIKFRKRLLVWFSVLGGCDLEENNSEIAHKNYCDVFDFLKKLNQLPEGIQEPIRAVPMNNTESAVVHAEVGSIIEADIEILSVNVPIEMQSPEIPLVATQLQKEINLNVQVLSSTSSGFRKEPKNKKNRTINVERHVLSPLHERGSVFNSDYSSESAIGKSISKSVRQEDSTHASVNEVLADLIDKIVENDLKQPNVALNNPNVRSSAELLRLLKEEDDALDLSSLAWGGKGKVDNDNDETSSLGGDSTTGSEFSHRSAASFGYEVYEATSSKFANEFIADIEKCISKNETVESKFIILQALILKTLNWHHKAKKYGLNANVFYAIQSLKVLQKNKKITSDEVYVHLYAVLHATVFAACAAKTADSAKHRHYYQDAVATLMQLRGLIAKSKLRVHGKMLKAKCTNGHSPLETLMHTDESACTHFSDKRTLAMKEKNMNDSAEKILGDLPFIWANLYAKKGQEKDVQVLEDRAFIEEMCANLLAEILRKETGTLTITEQAFVVRAMEDYMGGKENSPFYPALQFLAVTDNAYDAVALLGSEYAESRGVELCGKLYSKATPFTYADDSLSRHERVMNKRMWDSIHAMEPQGETSNDNWDTRSESSRGSYRSHQSGKSFSSAYTYKSTSSAKSTSSMRHKPNFAEVASIKQVGFESVWTSLFSKEMLNKAEVKFILKNFDAVIQKPDFEKSQSVALLNLAFDWLGKLPSTKLRGSVSNFFSSKENKDQDVAHPDFDGYMGYVAPPKNGSVSFLLVEYCAYQARKKGVMKTYEADFVKKYSQHLSQHDGAFNAYNSETFNEALSLADSVKSTALNKK